MILRSTTPRASIAALGTFICFIVIPAAAAQGSTSPAITSPVDGAVLQGQVSVTGNTAVADFSSAELAFAYEPDPTGTWFVVRTASLPAQGSAIALWDTTTITDGPYVLRLRVVVQDGSFQDASVRVRIANYTTSPTATVGQTAATLPPVQVPTAMIMGPPPLPANTRAASAPTLTPFPPNQAGVSTAQILAGFWRGALLVGAIVLIVGLLIKLRRY
jgi:hypothetical protein